MPNETEQAAAFREWLKKDNEGKPIVVEYREKGETKKVELKSDDEPVRRATRATSSLRSSRSLASVGGVDTRPILTCFIGIMLAIVLNKLTSFYTHTTHEPVKTLARACQTGHATNIIQGFAVGYESAVMATLVLAAAIALSVFCYHGSSPVFIAYGVAMAGIGMLTLTGNTISMDVFGPVADNANGIGEMGYNKDTNGQDLKPGQPGYMEPADYKRARQILADLDAVGNTTKAETKGIAIGSAVIAAVSMFASFIATLAMGSEDKIVEMSTSEVRRSTPSLLTVAKPMVFIGLLIGGVVPWLFSSMLIRAVGRAAFYIIKECRIQFRDKEIWAGTKKPNYARVVDICTNAAQDELIGPALLAVLSPILVGVLLGPYALGGFLAGMIVSGVMLGVFMANAGGAWDNAKKMIEDEPQGSGPQPRQGIGEAQGGRHRRHRRRPAEGHGRSRHQPAGQGDEHGRHALADQRGARLQHGGRQELADRRSEPVAWIGAIIAIVCVLLIVWAIKKSNTETAEMKEIQLLGRRRHGSPLIDAVTLAHPGYALADCRSA